MTKIKQMEFKEYAPPSEWPSGKTELAKKKKGKKGCK